jgi:hypothetical protein
MRRRVMDCEAIPDFAGHFRVKDVRQRFPAVELVIHDQMDRFRFQVGHGR